MQMRRFRSRKMEDSTEYTGRRVLAVPRCCQKRKGTQDRWRNNFGVADRDSLLFLFQVNLDNHGHCRGLHDMNNPGSQVSDVAI